MAQFDQDILDEHAATFCVVAQYRPAALCACAGSNNGIPKQGCPYCDHGFRYPVDSVNADVIRTAPNLRSVPENIATIFLGGARLTIPATMRDKTANPAFAYVHRGDVFCFGAFPERNSDLLKRGTRDEIWAFDISKIVSVRDENDVEYTETDDFSLDDRTIVWNSDAGPAVGVAYSVEFVASSQFIIYGLEPTSRGGDGTGAVLPKTVLAVRRTYQPETTADHPLNAFGQSIALEE